MANTKSIKLPSLETATLSTIEVPAYLTDYVHAMIKEAESKLDALMFEFPEDLPDTFDETNELLMNLACKRQTLLNNSRSYIGLEKQVERIRIDLSNDQVYLMEHIQSLEKPLHESWEFDLDVMRRFIFTDEPPVVECVFKGDNFDESVNIHATILSTHPHYKLGIDSNGEVNLEAIREFISDACDSVMSHDVDERTVLEDLDVLITEADFDESLMPDRIQKALAVAGYVYN
jgi:hypothetical protein